MLLNISRLQRGSDACGVPGIWYLVGWKYIHAATDKTVWRYLFANGWWVIYRLYVYVMPQMPLFTNVDDLMTSWERLKTEAGSEAKSPTIQVCAECEIHFHRVLPFWAVFCPGICCIRIHTEYDRRHVLYFSLKPTSTQLCTVRTTSKIIVQLWLKANAPRRVTSLTVLIFDMTHAWYIRSRITGYCYCIFRFP